MTFKHEKGMSGYYVYTLVDPRDNRIFYVGKGRGDRVFQHTRGTLPEKSPSLELDTIRSILDEGKLVHCYILRHNLTEKDADSTLSEFLGDKGFNMDKLVTKIVSRPDQWNHPWDEGIKTTNIYIHGCPKIDLTEGEDLLLVSLNKSYPKDAEGLYKRASIYENRKYWYLSIEKAREMDYVLGVYKGIVRYVYKPFSWKPYYKADDEHGGTHFKTIRWGFEGAFVLDSPYLTTDVSDYPFAPKSPVQYISKEGWDGVNWGKKTIVLPEGSTSIGAVAPPVAPPSAAAKFDLSELQKDVALGEKTIVVPAQVWDEDLPEIADRIKDGSNITLDLSKTKITNIGAAFNKCNTLKAIILPEGLASIVKTAFHSCPNLTKIDIASGNKNYSSVDGVLFTKDKKRLICFPQRKAADYYEIPEGITAIGEYAFHWCKALTQVTIPNGVTSIEDHAFSWCESLTQVMIPSSVTSIGYAAFTWCTSLEQITIPESVMSIGDSAFKGCNNLPPASIMFVDTSEWYFDTDFAWPADADDLAISLKNSKALYKKPLAAAVEFDLSELQKDVALGKKEIVIPAGAQDWNLTAIVDCIKKGEGIALDLSETKIKTIGKEAFASCDALKAIILPKGLVSIEDGAFRECSSLTDIEIPECVTSVGDHAFWGCEALRQVTVSESVTGIEAGVFGGCKGLADKDGFVIVRGILFDYTGAARSVVIPEGVTSIGESAFSWCKALVQVVIPSSVMSIGDEAFWECSSLKQVTVPNSVTSIGREAFSWCESLTQVMIPGSVTSIGKGAFNECTSLTQITFADTNDWYFDTDFARPAGAGDLAISLKAGKALYKKPPAEWADVNTKAKREMTVLMHASQNNTNPDVIKEPLDAGTVPAEPVAASSNEATNLDLSELKKAVASGKKEIVAPAEAQDSDLPAIVSCIKGVHDITLDLSETKITNIGTAFRQCQALKAIILPEGLVSIGRDAFWMCKSLIQVTIPNSVKSIGHEAFWGCKALKGTIPDSIKSIGNLAFKGCVGLADKDGFVIVGNILFDYTREDVISVTIPESVTSIECEAFSWCKALAQVTIPSGVKSIGHQAFWKCKALAKIKFADTSGWYFDKNLTNKAGTDRLASTLKGGRPLYKEPPDTGADVNTKAKREMTVLMHASQNNTNPDVTKGPPAAGTVAAEPVAVSSNEAAKLDLSELKKAVASGKKTIVVPAGTWDWNLPAIVDCIKKGTDIALDLSETKIKTIRDEAFESCDALKAIILPKGLTRIGDWAFWTCEALAQVTIPSSVTSIGNNAFGWCKALRQITFADTSGWYFEEYFATKVGADELASSLKVGWALYKKCADASAAYGNTNPIVIENLHATQADVNAKSKDGFSKLMFAVRDETAATVEELLDAGADVNAKNKGGTTALMLAAYHNRSADVVRPLLDAGADVNAKNKGGTTALILAATNNKNPNVFKMLLSAGADVNAKDKEGKTAIDYLEARDDKDKFIGTDVYQMMKTPLDKEARETAVHTVEVIDNAESDASAVESETRVSGRMDSLTASQRTALASLNLGGKFFLTGSAGTGKSYLIREFIAQQRKVGKNVLVTASTGIAAQNIGGATAHRAFNIPARPLGPKDCQKTSLPETVAKADVIVVDEVSMLRFDVCEFLLGMITKCPNNPTVVFVGDFWQLPPVIKPEDKEPLYQLWDLDETERGFAFQAQAWKDAGIKTLQLREVVRQKDEGFARALEKTRRGDWSGVEWIMAHRAKTKHKDAVGLYATNEAAGYMNEKALDALKGQAFEKYAEFYGEATAEDFNGDVLFKCKEGARVISLVNAKDGWSYQNGSIGTVTKIDRGNEEITVDFDRTGEAVVLPCVWSIKDYEVRGGKLLERERGSIRQMPLKLAYALTIHKSQGQTFSRVNLDPYCFDDGHLYVALSRCQSVDGLHFTAPPKREYLMSSQQVRAFYEG